LDEDLRKSSTLPYVGQGLLQLVERGHVHARKEDVHSRLVELVGADWEAMLEQGAATS
jgi:hypothetical protein